MGRETKDYAHPELVGGGVTEKHSHLGGGNGVNVKSGSVTGIQDGVQTQVNFATAFSSIPVVCATVKDAGGNLSTTVCVEDITTGGFKISTKGDDCDAYWIATDAGNN